MIFLWIIAEFHQTPDFGKNNEGAIDYLSQFSRFIRKVLNGSIYENTTLHDEIETAELYLSIESLRFNNFTYRIVVEAGISLNKYLLW